MMMPVMISGTSTGGPSKLPVLLFADINMCISQLIRRDPGLTFQSGPSWSCMDAKKSPLSWYLILISF